MQPAFKRFAVWTLFLACPSCLMAQQATIKRNSNLRSDPSAARPPIELLRKGATLTVLDPTLYGGYYHVKAEKGKEGWVWSRNVHIFPASPTTPQTPPAAPSVVGEISQCDASLWNHVYHPQRLIVKQKCLAVTGTMVDATNGWRIDGVRHEHDGDTHGWLNVDSQFKNLLNAGNMSAQS